MGYSYVFFDADNTLLDYDRAEERALSMTLENLDLEATPEMTRMYREINRQVWKEFEEGTMTQVTLRAERFRRFFHTLHLDEDPQGVSAFYLARLGEGNHLVDGALETVSALASVCTCCIVTNGLADVQRNRFSLSPLLPLMKGLVISEEVGSQKPEEGIFQAAMELCGDPEKESVLMVGDSLSSDIQGALRFGIDACWFNPKGYSPADGIIPTMEIAALEDLLPLFGLKGF
ncbi:MAG: YjjG family noncanonical pyrimidine nucleotidase [Spirochaetales bacterium]|nr:YjjG family noncanonical pyrimidine nucleotidase [Spirochaetales bacterium]